MNPRRRRLRATRIAGVAVVLGLALGARPAAAEGPPPALFEKGLLFRVEPAPRADATVEPSWIFGTIHLGGPGLEVPDVVAGKLESSDRYCMEVVLDAANLMGLMNRMFLPEDRSLDAMLGEETWAEAAAPLGALAGPFASRLQPWMAWMLLSVPPDANLDAMDLRLLANARNAGKEICQLETMEEQVEAVAGLSESDQVALVRVAVREHDGLSEQLERAVARYRARDLAGLVEAETGGSGLSPAEEAAKRRLMARLLDRRNAIMAERIAPRIDQGASFLAVGAAHLGGADGLLARLARAGYRVTREY